MKENYQYFYHPDHLGSSSYITTTDGSVSQHIEYLPYGELFLEERNNKWNTSYLFNAKELDEETGLYYYEQRYLDSRTSIWLSVDELRGKYPNVSSYVYCHNNPVNKIDPTGMADFEVQQPQLSYNKRTYVAGKNASPQSLSKDLGLSIEQAINIFQNYKNWDWGTNEDAIENVEGHTITIPYGIKIKESFSVKWSKFWGSVEHGAGDPANDDVGRLPDYYTLSGNAGFPKFLNIPSVSGSVTVDRYLQFYFTGSANVNSPSKKWFSGSLVAGQLLQSIKPSPKEMREFLSGESWSIGGGYWLGGYVTNSVNNKEPKSALNIGIMTPQVSGGYGFTPLIFNKK